MANGSNKSVIHALGIAALTLMFLTTPAAAQTEREYVEVLCEGMKIEVRLPSGARADCVSETYAYEVDFSENHSQALGQSLLYAAETGLKPGIFLICRQNEWTCAGHYRRLSTAVKYWRVPVAIETRNAGEVLE